MFEGSPQPPRPTSPVGYRPLIPAELTKGAGNSAYGYVAGAVGLGLALGVAVGVLAGHGRVAAAPQPAASTASYASGLGTLSASFAGPAPTLLSQVEPQRMPAPHSSLVSLVEQKSAVKHLAKHKRRHLRKLLDWKKDHRSHNGAFRKPYVSSEQTEPAPDQPTALQLATAAAAAGPFFLGIQGDVTVADYDAATGTIQTYEGETYLLAKNAGENGAIPWQNFPFNVHYRCDEIGNCTLSHAGASAIAKLTR